MSRENTVLTSTTKYRRVLCCYVEYMNRFRQQQQEKKRSMEPSSRIREIVSKLALVLLYRIQDRFRQQQQEKKRLWNHGVVFGIVSKTFTSVVM